MGFKFSLFRHQKRLVESPKKSVCMMGGVGSGKSFACELRQMKHLLTRKTEGIAVRKTRIEVEGVLLSDLKKTWSPWIKNIQLGKGIVELTSGSLLYLMHGWDDERGVDHIQGKNISTFRMSQAEHMPFQTVGALRERNRNANGLGEYQEIYEGNPSGKDWLYNEFIRGRTPYEMSHEMNGKKYVWTEYETDSQLMIQVPTQEFPWLPGDYISQVSKNKSKRYIDRYILGKFDAFSGIVYDCWSPENVIERIELKKAHDKGRYVRGISVDWGFRNPCACLWWLYDRVDDTYIVYRSYYGTGLRANEVGKKLGELNAGDELDIALGDPSMWNTDAVTGTSVSDELFQSAGLYERAQRADNDVERGIEQTYWYIANRRLLVMEGRCEDLEREIEVYKYGDDDESRPTRTNPKESPLKKADHACDAMRYMVASQHLYKEGWQL